MSPLILLFSIITVGVLYVVIAKNIRKENFEDSPRFREIKRLRKSGEYTPH